MQLKLTLAVIASVLTSYAPPVLAAEGDVLTATRVFHTVIRESPFLVDRTTTVVWTQGASVTEEAQPTAIPDTVGPADGISV
ncbi:hypothetical protein EST38_g9360 [Candolleomyces aberdarensis]|uniref:Uncharacterized protein n=1 Tax=Candolleomyces aberdarensis TaxID=2316362 RepID=A0A4Q2DBV3_9AGAR|nr:hypothetical protein EST38_g9360 [Candolleomyces aberdarensis]